MKGRIILSAVIAVVLAYFFAAPLGGWIDENYASGGFIYWGPFPGFLDGLLLNYIFFASLLAYLSSGLFKIGVYFTLPVFLLFIVIGAVDPHLWLSLLLLAAGLGLAWVILKLKAYFTTS